MVSLAGTRGREVLGTPPGAVSPLPPGTPGSGSVLSSQLPAPSKA